MYVCMYVCMYVYIYIYIYIERERERETEREGERAQCPSYVNSPATLLKAYLGRPGLWLVGR